MKTVLLALLLAVNLAHSAGSLEPTSAALGQLIVTQFISAPFPHPSRAEGRKYKDEFYPADKHYADSTVALFIPKGFHETGHVDFIVHFHGWRNTVAGTLQQYKLIEQLVASGKNAVLLVPEGPHNAPDSGGGKLEDPEGFRRFIGETLATLKQRGVLSKDAAPGGIILSGHSGGYQVIASILDRGGLPSQVREVWLFDALYAQGDKFLAWSDKGQGRLLNIYTDGGGTKARSEEMMAILKQRGTSILVKPDPEVSSSELKTNRLVFLHTDLGHNDVVEKRQTFREFLKTSFLDDIK